MKDRVSPKSILLGDVIHYHGHINLPEDEKPETDVGIVVDIREKGEQIIGFDVIPLQAVPISTHIEDGPGHYRLSRDEKFELEDMGLETQGIKYNALFQRQIVLNAAAHLSTDGHGGVTRYGSLTGTQLIENILRKEIASSNDCGSFLQGAKEVRGMSGSPHMANICDTQSVEAGKVAAIEVYRQDAADAEYFGNDGIEPL